MSEPKSDTLPTPADGIPPLAGLCTMEEAIRADWSVDESVRRLKHLHYVLRRFSEIFTFRLTGEPFNELKSAYSHHAYLCAEHVSAIRQRVGEMREPPLGLEVVPHPALERFCNEILCTPGTEELVLGLYGKGIPALIEGFERLRDEAHPLADAPTVRLARFALLELEDIRSFGKQAIDSLVPQEKQEELAPWLALLEGCLAASGRIDGTTEAAEEAPAAHFSNRPYEYERVPRRDERFHDPYNAGVNPEAFLYDERFSPRDKTLMMYYKRIRELDVPEMMASILHDLRDDEPWEFHFEMLRQLWDEARHAMMGEVGFTKLGIDWTKIPINFTWSLNLNTQLNARERHGVLFFIEQGLMPKTGKRFEWEVGLASGDPLAGLFQDFDWADEVLHAQIGRRWYVPRFASLNEALEYGDDCWSRVLSHWQRFRDEGLTEHRNWWPEIYSEACARWGTVPDPEALAFSETYEETRADLKDISMSG